MTSGRASFLTIALGLLLTGLAARAGASGVGGAGLDVDHLGLGRSSGWRIDARVDHLNQNQLRSGTGRISPAAASQVVVGGAPQQVERFTKSDQVTLGLDYSPTADWGVNLQVPYTVRSHSTLGTASDGAAAGAGGGQFDSRTSRLGDLKLVGRYQGFRPKRDIGIAFGLKLPTGSHTRTGTSTDPSEPGPVAIDRSLQPGTGTTDLILGAHAFGPIDADWEVSAQAAVQVALHSKDGYRPGMAVNLDLGLRYMSVPLVIPQLQLNIRRVQRDHGANVDTAADTAADTVSTGGTLAYLSPGIALPVGLNASFFGFVQVPIYQNVNGVQVVPRLTVSIGGRYTF